MDCRFRVKKACLDEVLYSVEDNLFIRYALCYPPSRCRENLFLERLRKCIDIGIEYLVDYGSFRLYKYNVIGKGYSSIATLCIHNGFLRLVKIRRIDSRRSSLEYEGMLLEYLSPYKLVPRVYYWSRDFIVMDFIVGKTLREYISYYLEKGDLESVRDIIRRVLVKAYILDSLGVDHGELNRPGTHVLIDENKDIYFIDFESARYGRRTHNLTSIASYFFIRSWFRDRILDTVDREKIITRLQHYKKYPSLKTLRSLLELLDYL